MKRTLTALTTAIILSSPVLAQTAPEVFVFRPGTPIVADEMNANFQLLRDHINNALGLADLTTEELQELTAFINNLIERVESGELDGESLTFSWDGTQLGIKHDSDQEFTFVDLLGPTGPQGEVGAGLEHEWQGTSLGIRNEGDADYTWVDLLGPAGPAGPQGEQGPAGLQGDPGPAGPQGPQGPQGPEGERGATGPPGEQGPTGLQGPAGEQGERGNPGPAGPAGAQGDPGPTGLSAYGIAVTEGFTGTPADWLNSLIGPQGPQGPQGIPGQDGIDGVDGLNGVDGIDGRTLLNGTTAPDNNIGDDGDFYINTNTWDIYGPKASGTWPAGVSLTAPAPTFNDSTDILVAEDQLFLDSAQKLPFMCSNGNTPSYQYGIWICADILSQRFGSTRSANDGRVSYECMLGDIHLSAVNNFAPGLIADGRLLPINQNTALYSLLGTTYGGDGVSTFAIPDLRDAAPKSANGQSMHYYICDQGLFPSPR